MTTGPVIWGGSNTSQNLEQTLLTQQLALAPSLTGNQITHKATTVSSAYSINWPSAQGAASTVPQNDGSGNLSWVANTASLPAAYVGTNPQVGGSSPFQMVSTNSVVSILSPAGAITVKLPTTGIAQGQQWTIKNTTLNLVTIQSSGGNYICTIAKGFVTLTALVATPTTTANWDITEINSGWFMDTNFSTAGFGTVTNYQVMTVRNGNTINGRFYFDNSSAPTSACSIIIPSYYTLEYSNSALSGNNYTPCGNWNTMTNSLTTIVPNNGLGPMFLDGLSTTSMFFASSTSGLLYVKATGSNITGSTGLTGTFWFQTT